MDKFLIRLFFVNQTKKDCIKNVLNKVLELQLDPSDFEYKEVNYPDGSSQQNVIYC